MSYESIQPQSKLKFSQFFAQLGQKIQITTYINDLTQGIDKVALQQQDPAQSNDIDDISNQFMSEEIINRHSQSQVYQNHFNYANNQIVQIPVQQQSKQFNLGILSANIINSVNQALNELRQNINQIDVDDSDQQQNKRDQFNQSQQNQRIQNNQYQHNNEHQNNKNVNNKHIIKNLKEQTNSIQKEQQQHINKIQQNCEKQIKCNQKLYENIQKEQIQSINQSNNNIQKYNQTQYSQLQSKQVRKNNSSDSKRSSKYKSDHSDQFNFDLTLGSKYSKNPFTLTKQDSLMYSNASQFGYVVKSQMQQQSSPLKQNNNKKSDKHSQSNKTILNKIDDEGQLNQQPSSIVLLKKSQSKQILNSILFDPSKQKDQNAEIQVSVTQEVNVIDKSIQNDMKDREDYNHQIAQSATFQKQKLQKPARKRIDTEADKPKKNKLSSKSSSRKMSKGEFSRLSVNDQSSSSNIFSTQINTYNIRIAKIRQNKQMKKKKLEQQLVKVNQQLKVLNLRQSQHNQQSIRNFANRVQINDDHQALQRAEILVKNLRSQKKHRYMAKLGQFKNLDRNITDYMQQLTKLREQNENKLKQKKKLEILERMKQKEIQKKFQRQKKQASINFVMHLKTPQKSLEPPVKKSPTKRTQVVQQNATPELSQKKAYLHKVRQISIKKSSTDLYQQALS